MLEMRLQFRDGENPKEEEMATHCRILARKTPWTVAHAPGSSVHGVARQALLSMGFSRQEFWSGLPFSSPGDLAHPENKLGSLALQADSLKTEPPGKP